MLNNMLGDLHLYLRLIGMQLRAQMQYKVNLLIDIVTYFLISGLEFAAIMLLFGPFPSILGWSIGEVAFLYSLTSMSFGLAELFGAGATFSVDLPYRVEAERAAAAAPAAN